MDDFITYRAQAIDPNILSVFDISTDGKVVSAKVWCSLWELVIKHLNTIDSYCAGLDVVQATWKDSKAKLEKIINDFRAKYDALSESFTHCGDTEPTNTNIKFWIEEVDDLDDDLVLTHKEFLELTKLRVVNITLDKTKWYGSGPYTQTVSIEGVTPLSKIDFCPTPVQLQDLYNKGMAFIAENKSGTVTIYCIGQRPTTNITLQVNVTEVYIHE